VGDGTNVRSTYRLPEGNNKGVGVIVDPTNVNYYVNGAYIEQTAWVDTGALPYGQMGEGVYNNNAVDIGRYITTPVTTLSCVYFGLPDPTGMAVVHDAVDQYLADLATA